MGYREDIAAAKLQIQNVTNERIVDTVLRLHTTLVSNPPKGTPIDFGWASVNWFIGIGTPTSGNGGLAPAGSELAAVASRSAEQSATVASLITSYDYTRGTIVYVGNNVPYIRPLNNGSSSQSPAGFVDDAVQDAVTWANSQ